MYERINKLNNKINIYISNINNRFPYFKYKNNYNTSKAHDFLFNKKIQVPIYKPSNKLFFNPPNYKKNKEQNFITLNNNKLDHLFIKFRNNKNYKSNKNIFHTKTIPGFKKNIKNNDQINKKIKELKEEINIDKNYFDFKILDYKNKNKNNMRKTPKLLDFKNKRNKSFEYKKRIFNINDKYLKTFSINKNNNVLYMRNTNKKFFDNDFNTVKNMFRNNNFIITQNNTNNYFFLNYNNHEKEKNKFSFNNYDISKESEENSIDINNIDNSSILDK